MSRSDRARTAVIVGAGIGGLAAGVALRRAGWTVRVHERASAVRELGFGVGLAENALIALRELGVADAILAQSPRMDAVELRYIDGRTLRRFNLPVGLPAVVTRRPLLHGALYDALLALVGTDVVQCGHEAVSITHEAHGATVHFADGSSDRGDVVVGADGIQSVARRVLHPHEAPPHATPFTAVRGVAPLAPGMLDGLSGIGYLDDGIEAATVRAAPDVIYWYLSLLADEVRSDHVRDVVNDALRGCDPALRAVIDATPPDAMRLDRLYLRAPLRQWGAGRVTLLGDAAHPVMPHTGQGAAQSLEDAVGLGRALGRVLHGSDADITAALRRYETVRGKRTKVFIAIGPRIARVTTTHNPIINALRSAALRFVPVSVMGMAANANRGDPYRGL